MRLLWCDINGTYNLAKKPGIYVIITRWFYGEIVFVKRLYAQYYRDGFDNIASILFK